MIKNCFTSNQPLGELCGFSSLCVGKYILNLLIFQFAICKSKT
jgi:hypothetical protein